ncbi:hypothetical protein ACVINY_004108 [Sinorhizobium meliloti]|uniref:hypothetical protein n=1 Tax=Rhizobium meliloti TaxID=382 RepID=UPI000FD8AF62|nr:hypothetical protein [Sinorhizobium meliloti]RVL12938.1 hypothetical protein CN147_31950 [Sinorhizobium meliloti]
MTNGADKRDRLGQRAAYGKCEEILGLIGQRPSSLTVPNKWPFEARPGGSVTGAQLAVTWARKNHPLATLRLNDDVDPEHAAETLVSRTYGLVAASFADRIIGRDGSRDVTSGMLKVISHRLSDLYSGSFDRMIHGQSLPLVSIDHLERRGPNPFLYHPGTGEVRGDFLGLVQQALMRLIDRNRLRRQDIDAELLASLFKELFSNTHLHARNDLSGALYRRSARGIVFALRPVDLPQDTFAGDLAPLREYFSSIALFAARPRVEFLEVSVFDSGPGLAARAKGSVIPEEMPVEQEYDLVQRCFLKNVTTQIDPAHGLGLPRVMLALKTSGGFMRLRTGRLALYKWFPPGMEAQRIVKDDLRFVDENGGRPRAHARVAGTAFSILIPTGLGS